MPKSDIPFGSEFGPKRVTDLARLLELLAEHSGDASAIVKAVALEYGWPPKTAKNTLYSVREYRLLEDDRVTALARRLLDLRDRPEEMHAEFARHILLHLNGLHVVTAIDGILRAGEESPTQLTIAAYLRLHGIYVPPSGTHVAKMIGWLQRAGVFREVGNYESLDMGRVHELIGAAGADLDALSEMPSGQRCVLKALANLPFGTTANEAFDAAQVRQYAETVYGEQYNPKNFPRAILEPLARAGYITIERPIKRTGEGARERVQVSGKSLLIRRTAKFANEHLPGLVDALSGTGLAVRKLLRKPLTEILPELRSTKRNEKGRALEALAFYFLRLLDLEFRAWRKRARDTGGFEVDLIVEGARLVFSRWQVQCKNTPKGAVPEEDIAKEVGISLKLRSNVILFVTTGRFTRDARQYADTIMATTPLNIVLLDQSDLAKLTGSPLQVVPMLNERARRAMEIKRI